MSNTSEVIELTKELVSRPSVTPVDAGCQELIKQHLSELGFNNETMVFEDTTNLWARRGNAAPVFCFAGHTDVVPVGNLDKWSSDPFVPIIKNGWLYGRGAADMKGSLAAMLVATERFVKDYPYHNGSIAFLITSDEEGPFINGTTRVIDTLEARNEKIDWCIVGEPSSTDKCGDIVKNGRRGSITADVHVHGVQGHVAYPHLVKNPIHMVAPALAELAEYRWDNGNDYFPPTSLQFSNINAGTGATNVVPGELHTVFNLRYSTEINDQFIVDKVTDILNKHQLDYEINWTFNGQPFLTEPGDLLNAVITAVEETNGVKAQPSTSGGTSDGRFIAPTGAQVVELGPTNATIHKVNECVNCQDLEDLVEMYYLTMKKLLVEHP
ncbi:succinyl-diaminopimelate desuccinylase [Thalassotalea ponticola]|uniref:succinyl-diaminopimelate desuccinylase n=1 Tax=Thalassotalea ponticola TaxID=1523392 RepID=UPI0025B40113|nr:succinyl-diaminopimelate desuccinylase [Thalassotalea ponticola]MDN3651250.1 succinyl-diaminopimelate desuccinylase [Thalassotalea ponticola]